MAVSMIYGIPEKMSFKRNVARGLQVYIYIVPKYSTINVVLSKGVKGLTKWEYVIKDVNIVHRGVR